MHDNGEIHRRIVEAVPEGIWVVGTQGETTFCNDRMAEILGTDVETLQKMTCFDSLFPEDLEEARRHFGLQMSGNGQPFDFRLRRFDGSPVWVRISCRLMRDGGGVSTGLLGLFTDISERRQAEKALHESEERFRNMADTAPVMIWVAGPDKLCTYFNTCCLNFTGHSLDQKVGEGWIAAIHPEDREEFLGVYSSSFDVRREFQTVFRLRRVDGEYRQVLTTGVPRFTSDGAFVGFIGSCVDITEVRRTQERDLARQKLESVGVLAGGIAHDFNNLLAGIQAEAELATAELELGESPLAGLERIGLAARRGAEIVRELMIYSGQENDEPIEHVDLSRLVEEMMELLKVSVSKHTVLKIDLHPNLPFALGRASQIRQILMNLILNASEAIGDKAGIIRVTALGTSWPGGSDRLKLEVSDTGAGMTKEVQARVFDPFFSTKFPGRGMGLAVVQGIVRDHGGVISLVSAPGRGTKFEIFLPCVSETVPPSPPARPHALRMDLRPRLGTVLVVEDEELLRVAVSKMLRNHGFGVMEAGDGSSALDLIGAPKNKIDLMLLDATLPGASSREVLEEARRTRPGLKAILTSAYSRETVDASFDGMPIERFIRKPFQFTDLMGLLQDASSK